MVSNFMTDGYEEQEEREIDPVESSMPVDTFFRKNMGFSLMEQQEIPYLPTEEVFNKLL